MGKRGVIRPLLISWRRLLPGRPASPAVAHRRSPLFEQLEGRQLLTAATAPVVDAVWQGHNVQVVKGEYVVEIAAGANIAKLAKESSFKNVTRVGASNFYSLSSVKNINQMETWAANRPAAVVAITPNLVTQPTDLARPNDPNYQYQWQYENTGQITPSPVFDPDGLISFGTLGHTGGEAGTPGADMPDQIPESVKTERLAALNELITAQMRGFGKSCVGRTLDVLLEKPGRMPGQLGGRSPYLQAVHLEAPERLIGTVQPVLIVAAGNNSIEGKIVTHAEPKGASVIESQAFAAIAAAERENRV